MDARPGAEHGQSPLAMEANFFSAPIPERSVDREKRPSAEEQDNACTFLDSATIRSSTYREEAPEARFSTEGSDARNDNGILSCLEHLCRTFSPLGKSIDYVQSDLASIAKERASITEEIRRQQIEVETEKKIWGQLLQRESQKLQQAKLLLQQEKDDIAALAAQVLHTQARIQLILRGVTHSEEVTRFVTKEEPNE